MYLRLGISAIAKPQVTSNPPTTRRYHFDGSLYSKIFDNGKTFAYLTYSFRYMVRQPKTIIVKLKLIIKYYLNKQKY